MHGGELYVHSILCKGATTLATLHSVQQRQQNNAMVDKHPRQKFQTLHYLSELLAARWLLCQQFENRVESKSGADPQFEHNIPVNLVHV